MSTLLLNLLVMLCLVLLVVPYIAVFCLRVLLRQYGFRASVGGPKTFTNICLKTTVKMNLQVLVNIQSIKIEFRFPQSLTELTELFNY